MLRDAYRNARIDLEFRTTGTQFYAGLMATAPANSAATGTEATGTGLSRQSHGANSQTEWIATQDTPGSPGSAAASSGTTGRTANGYQFDFGTVGADWPATAAGVALFEASTGGTWSRYYAFSSALTLVEGAHVYIPAGGLQITKT